MSQTEPVTIYDHLEELRTRLILVLIVVGVAFLFSFAVSDQLLEFVVAPIKQSVDLLYFFSPHEAFMTKMKLSLVTGIILSLPVIFYQLWKFVSPGLYASEKQKVLPLVFLSTGLFLLGIAFAYYGIVPFALNFFLNFQTDFLVPLISIGSYISFFLSLILVFGAIFELPVILVGLVALGVVKTQFLKAQRKAAIVLIFVLAAILTPTVDLVTQLLLALPLWILFELSIWIGRQVEKKDVNQ